MDLGLHFVPLQTQHFLDVSLLRRVGFHIQVGFLVIPAYARVISLPILFLVPKRFETSGWPSVWGELGASNSSPQVRFTPPFGEFL